jgi:hypothetical protein
MIFIAHRGNIKGSLSGRENQPSYIEEALNKGYDVEVDVWYYGNGEDEFLLGHDAPDYPIQKSFLMRNHIWCHAKNVFTLEKLLELNAHCFFHDFDDCVLTSRNKIWVYPGKKLVKGCVAVLPENANYEIKDLKNCLAICTDNVEKYKEILK